jgi:hypothetical protein
MDSGRKNDRNAMRVIPFIAVMAAGLRFGEAPCQISFTNIGESSHTRFACNPHGSGFFDATGDGWDDVFIVENSSVGGYLHLPHMLLKNMRSGIFENIAAQAGVEGYLDISAQGLAAADYNNDGRMDLCIGMGSPSYQALLYRQKPDGTFEDVSDRSIPDQYSLFGRCLAFMDYDRDGWLDLFFLVTGLSDNPSSRLFCLYRNSHNDRFVDVTLDAGLGFRPNPDDLYGFATADVDNDLDVDVFIPRLDGSSLFLHNRNGVFHDATAASGLPNAPNCIGAVFFDYNNDGFFDLFVKRQEAAPELYRNDGDGTFTNVSVQSGLSGFPTGFLPTSSSFGGGCTAADFDNDGNTDILLTNRSGSLNKLFRNRGDGTFEEVAGPAGLVEPFDHYWTSPVADFDRDGYLDLYFARSASDPNDPRMYTALYRNNGGSNRSFSIRLAGVRSNRSGVGARLRAYAGGRGRTRQVQGGDGYKVNSYWTHFGLGALDWADSLVIYWPSGTVQRATEIPAHSFLTITEKDTVLYFGPPYVAGKVTHSVSGRPIPGVRVELTGDAAGRGMTDAAGRYRVKPIPAGTPSAVCTPGKTRGDDVPAGVVSAYDASLVLRFIAGLDALDSNSRKAADADGNGGIDAFDAALIARYAVGLVDDSPSRAGQWSFEPGSRSYAGLKKELEGQDYRGSVIGDVSGNWGGDSAPAKAHPVLVFPDTVIAGDAVPWIDVKVLAAANPGMQSLEFRVEYDASVLSFEGCRSGESASGFSTLHHSPSPGTVNLVLYGVRPVETPGSVVILRFKPAGPRFVSTSLDFSGVAVDERPAGGGRTRIRAAGGNPESAAGFQLHPNAPNPFNSETTITFDLEKREFVRLDVCDAAGRSVRVLVRGWLEKGGHRSSWDGRGEDGSEMPSGLYLSRLTADGRTAVLKMVRTR